MGSNSRKSIGLCYNYTILLFTKVCFLGGRVHATRGVMANVLVILCFTKVRVATLGLLFRKLRGPIKVPGHFIFVLVFLLLGVSYST